MIDAGLPLVQCLEILSNQEPNKIFQAALRDIKSTVEQGATFSDALRRHPKIFDDLFVNLVQAGEVGGILDTILNRLAVYIEKRVKLARQLRGALSYPIAVMVIMVIVLIILMTFVIPAFEGMFAEFGAKDALPALTKLVIGLSKSFVNYLPFTATLGIGAFVFGTYFYRSARGKKLVHRTILQIPIMGPVLQKIAVARFTRTLGTLLASGVPILDALDIVAKTAGNVIVEEGLLYTRARISEGKNMAEPPVGDQSLPGDGGPDGGRRRADRRARHHAQQDRRLLRGRGGRRRRRAHVADRADLDGPRRRDGRRRPRLDVPADLLARRQYQGRIAR